jgi:general secretion pathway protein A
MYTAFYGLREKPFALSPDPRFLYLAGSHREALAHLLYGIEEGEGFISVTGEVGTGKTTLCRTLLERLDGDTEVAFLFNPSRTALELLQSICAEFGLLAEGLTRRSLMTQLDAFLVERKRQGQRVLLIIDEAQTLSENTLEQVRLLSNLETSREKLIQILLLGQPELDRKLDGRGLRQLRQRISVRWKLEPLSPEETRAYVRHRLSVAAGAPKELFSEAALREVHWRTGGVPRLVNQLCDRALLAGYAARSARIRPALIRSAAREIPDARKGRRERQGDPHRPSIFRPWMFLVASIALVGLALFAGLQVGRHGLADALRFSSAEDPPLAENSPVATPPAVGANAPSTSIPVVAVPPVARLIGFVESHSEEKPGSDQDPPSEQPKRNGVVSASASIAIPESPLSGVKLDVTALSPGLFRRLLANRDRQNAMADSQRAILVGFGRRTPALTAAPRTVDALQSGIESRGLTLTPFDGGSIDLLRRLDHPVLLPLTTAGTNPNNNSNSSASNSSASDSEPRWLGIIGFRDDRVHVAGLISNRIVTIPVDELADHWLETGIIVWERFDGDPGRLQIGEEGRGVLWLQRSLAELHFFEGRPDGTFDNDTLAALTRFQREHGLVSDGVAGPLTQIALYGLLERYPVPRLSRDEPTRSRIASPRAPSPSRAEIAQDSGDRG